MRLDYNNINNHQELKIEREYFIFYFQVTLYGVRFAQVIIVIVLSTDPMIPAIKAPMIDASKK